MADDLKGMKVAILATDGVERIELEQPRGAPLLLPSGTVNPDGLRIDPDAVGFVKAFAATCHGPWTLIETDVVRVDGGFTSSRSPADLPAFCPAILAQFAKAGVTG
jgi:protease I